MLNTWFTMLLAATLGMSALAGSAEGGGREGRGSYRSWRGQFDVLRAPESGSTQCPGL